MGSERMQNKLLGCTAGSRLSKSSDLAVLMTVPLEEGSKRASLSPVPWPCYSHSILRLFCE